MGLIQGALEEAGIATTGVSVCRELTEKVRPPRALCVPFPFGFPLGVAGDAALQRRILLAALALLEAPGPPPVIEEFAA